MKKGNTAEGQAEVDAQFGQDFLEGMSRDWKTVPCKYLYDEEGARLFEAICELEEYYPTRTEMGILRENMGEIVSLIGPECTIVEFGSGSGVKTRLLLDAVSPAAYVPIDVSRKQLVESSRRLVEDYPGMQVSPVCADFTEEFELPIQDDMPAVIFFPGSTIGNFEPEHAEDFLHRMAGLVGPDGGVLIGVDLKKDPAVLHDAYNDARGVTAAFNLNLLVRANRELDANFDLELFEHDAFYNTSAGRIEMHLASLRAQNVWVGDRKIAFAQGETIRTEYSYKYSLEQFREMAGRAGLRVARCWTDEREWFSLQYLRRF